MPADEVFDWVQDFDQSHRSVKKKQKN